MFEPLSDALIEDAALGPGQSALDVAAGTGEPSLRIAEVCGPSTWVTCTDPVADMIAVSKREARRRSLRGGNASTGTVTLSAAAPAGGAVVSLSSSAAVATVLPA